jgi:glycosyltransferase involved in cell wall biosynthesis
MSRRILFVEMAHGFGGSIVSLYQLVRGMDRSRYEPVILFYRPNAYMQQFKDLGARVIVLYPDTGEEGPEMSMAESRGGSAGRLRRMLASTYSIVRQVVQGTARLLPIIRREQIDLVHLNDVFISNREGVVAARLAGVPCLSHIRAFERLTPFDRYLTRYVAAFVYISQAIAASHEEQGVPAGRGRVIYNALAPEEFDAVADRAGARAELGLDASHQVVGLIGRLVAWKGHRVFLSAMASLVQTHPTLRGLIVGDGEVNEPAYQHELEALAAELRLSDRVMFTGYRACIPALLPALDVLVHCSLRPEPFGRVIIEGMAAGVPVVGAADGAVPEIIEDGRSGLLTPPGDAGALAAAIQRLLDDQFLVDAVRQAARQRVCERFSVDAHVQQIQAVYQEILG